MLFSYKIFTFSQLFSQHPNKFYYRKFQNHSQIPIHRTNHSQISIHRTNHSQIPTPHTTETPIQPTAANSGNQKPQPPKHHYHTTTTTTKIKITQKSKSHTERDWWVEGSRSKARSSDVVRSARCCDRRDRCDLVRAIIGLELGVHRRRQRRDLSFLFFLSLSLSLSWSENHLKWK